MNHHISKHHTFFSLRMLIFLGCVSLFFCMSFGFSLHKLSLLKEKIPQVLSLEKHHGSVLSLMTSDFGSGKDGACTVSGIVDITTSSCVGRSVPDAIGYAIMNNVFFAGKKTITLPFPPSQFAVGDEVLIMSLQTKYANDYDVGKYDVVKITSIQGNTIGFDLPLVNYYDSSFRATIIQRIPQYSTISIAANGVLTAAPWDGKKGGVLAIRANGMVTIAAGGSISMAGKGFRGGKNSLAGGSGGEAFCGLNGGATGGNAEGNTPDGYEDNACGGGGGGAAYGMPAEGQKGYLYGKGTNGTTVGGGGGGGGHATVINSQQTIGGAGGGGGNKDPGRGGTSTYSLGRDGQTTKSGAGGSGGPLTQFDAYGGGGGGGGTVAFASTSAQLLMGSGGGAGGAGWNGCPGGKGSAGGGVMILALKEISNAGSITVEGANRIGGSQNSSTACGGGAGGAGAGGSIYLVTESAGITVNVKGGNSGVQGGGGAGWSYINGQ